MKVVFLKDIPGKGRRGEVKTVSEGYARNFLLPHELAVAATPAVMKQVDVRLQKEEHEEMLDHARLTELAKQIEESEIHLKAQIGSGERLFGSITTAAIAEELSRVTGSPIDKRKVDMDKPIRQAGNYAVGIKLAKGLEPKVKIIIESEKA